MEPALKVKREKYLDIIKGIAILMVINVHIPDGLAPFKGITFHIFAFFLVAGILIYKKNEENLPYKELFIKKLKAIAWPYFTLSLIYIVINAIVDTKDVLIDTYISLSLLGIGTLWFLPTLFLGEVLFIVCAKKFKKQLKIIIPIILVLSIGVAFFLTNIGITGKGHFDIKHNYMGLMYNEIIVAVQSIIAMGFVGIGYLIGQLIENKKILQYGKKISTIIGIIFLILSVIVGIKMKADLHYANIKTPIIYLIGTLIGGLGILYFSYGIENLKFIEKIFSWLGQNSIIIMTTHLEYKIVSMVYKFSRYIPITNNILIGMLILISVALIEIPIIMIVNKTRLKYIYKFPKIGQK